MGKPGNRIIPGQADAILSGVHGPGDRTDSCDSIPRDTITEIEVFTVGGKVLAKWKTISISSLPGRWKREAVTDGGCGF